MNTLSTPNPSPGEGKKNRRVWPIVLVSLAVAGLVCAVCAGATLFVGMKALDMAQLPSPTATRLAAATATPPQIPSATPAPANPGQTPRPAPSPTPQAALTNTVSITDTQMQLRVFRQLWDAVNTSYVYTNFNGLDWEKVRASQEARINAGMVFTDFYDDMRGVVESLNDNHSSFLSPEEVQTENAEYEGKDAYVGVGVRWDMSRDKKYVFVLQTMANSPAEKGGVKAHDHILAINGEPVINGNELRMDRARGVSGTPVTLTLQAPGGQPRDVVLIRGDVSGAARVEYRVINNAGKKYGYILIPTLFEQTIGQKTREALRALNKNTTLDGIILDMRINGGGAYPILTETLGFFTTGEIGRLVNRSQRPQVIRVKAEPIGKSQTLPLVVLMGPSTESYAEVFSGALQAKGRAALIGSESAGNIETLRLHEFKDGSAAWIAEETFRLPNGTGWEGKGLTPDVRVDKNWDEFTEDDDPGIAAALNYFK